MFATILFGSLLLGQNHLAKNNDMRTHQKQNGKKKRSSISESLKEHYHSTNEAYKATNQVLRRLIILGKEEPDLFDLLVPLLILQRCLEEQL